MSIFEDFKTNSAPSMITGMVCLNFILWLLALIPILEPAFLGLIFASFIILVWIRIDDETLADFIGKKIGAVFSKNHLLALSSVLLLTFLSVNCFILYKIGQF